MCYNNSVIIYYIHCHTHTLVWTWHCGSVWRKVRLDHSIFIACRRLGDGVEVHFVGTDGVYLVAGGLDHLTSPLCRPYHFSNIEYIAYRHIECAYSSYTGRQKKDQRTTFLILIRDDNSPSRCLGKGQRQWRENKMREKESSSKKSSRDREKMRVEERRIGPLVFFFSLSGL